MDYFCEFCVLRNQETQIRRNTKLSLLRLIKTFFSLLILLFMVVVEAPCGSTKVEQLIFVEILKLEMLYWGC